MKAKAVARAGTPANASLYLAHVDDYLAKVDKLDDATRAQFGSDYAFIFQYLYPRVYELRGSGTVSPIDLINLLTALNEATGTTATGTALTATESLVNAGYREVLLRDPDAGGLPYWKGQVDNGTFNASTLPLAMACAAKDAAGADGTNAKAWLARTSKTCGAAAVVTGTAVTNADAKRIVGNAYKMVFNRTPLCTDQYCLDRYKLRQSGEEYWMKKVISGTFDESSLAKALSCTKILSYSPFKP